MISYRFLSEGKWFPSAKRSAEGLSEHFIKEGLVALNEYYEKKMFEAKLKEMKSVFTTQIAEETDISEVIDDVKQQVKDAKIPDIEVSTLSVGCTNGCSSMVWKEPVAKCKFCTLPGENLGQTFECILYEWKARNLLMYKVQIQCYEDAKLMKLIPEIISSLYDQDVLTENTILLWFRKGANPKGR